MNSVTLFDQYIQPTLINPEYASRREKIDLCARASQVIFGVGCILSTLKTAWQLGLLVTGGSFFFHGFLLTMHACEALGCHELFRVADNISSIYNKDAASRVTHAYLGNIPNFFTSIIKAESLTDIKKSYHTHLGSVPGFTSALTDNTFVLQHFNKQINEALNTPLN